MKCLEHPVSGIASADFARTKDKLQAKFVAKISLVLGSCQVLFAVLPPIVSAALAPF